MQVATHEDSRSNNSRWLKLERVSEEETKIRELEQKIGEARRNDQSIDALVEERRRTYDAWISRLDRELTSEKDKAQQDSLRNQLERARRNYG